MPLPPVKGAKSPAGSSPTKKPASPPAGKKPASPTQAKKPASPTQAKKPAAASPKKPASPPSGKGSARRPATRSKSVAPAADKGPPPVPTLPAGVTQTFSAEETLQREDVERQEQLAYCAMTLHRNDGSTMAMTNATTRTAVAVAALEAATSRREELTGRAEATLAGTVERTTRLFDTLESFIQRTETTEGKRLADLEKRVVELEHELQLAYSDLEHQRGVSRDLQNTLSVHLIHAEEQHEALRADVRAGIEQHAVDFDALKQKLHARVDAAVLQFHKPQFDSKLKELKDIQDATTKEVDEHRDRMHHTIDTIGATGAIVEAKSMHTQIPQKLRRDLEELSKDELLRLIDILSFEPGVISGVARAVINADRRRTQTVF